MLSCVSHAQVTQEVTHLYLFDNKHVADVVRDLRGLCYFLKLILWRNEVKEILEDMKMAF